MHIYILSKPLTYTFFVLCENPIPDLAGFCMLDIKILVENSENLVKTPLLPLSGFQKYASKKQSFCHFLNFFIECYPGSVVKVIVSTHNYLVLISTVTSMSD